MARKDFFGLIKETAEKKAYFESGCCRCDFYSCFCRYYRFFRIPYLQVEKIEISGNSLVAGDDLIEGIKVKLDGKYLGLFPKTNIFIIPKGKILAELPPRAQKDKKYRF